MRRLILWAALLILLGLGGQNASAANGWYWGRVTQVITSGPDGSFTVYIDNPTLLETCAHRRVDFLVTDMGAERTKAALSMALMAHASGKNFGIVVDLPLIGERCAASPTASQGAGVKN